VFDPRAFDADVETVAHFPLVLGVQLAPQKCGDVVGLDRMNRCPGQVAIDGRHIRLPPEDDVGGIFALIHTPV